MSWSYNGIGKPSAVLEDAQLRLSAVKCSEPEETIKNKVGDILLASLSAFPESSAVQVEAYGSQTVDSTTGKATNSLHFDIKPLYGFVED